MAESLNIKSKIDSYINAFPTETNVLLTELRNAIIAAAPNAEETISYGMPAFRQIKIIAYYAGYKNHIGFYPTALPIEHFKTKLKEYKTSKGAIQFPLNKPLPLTLIREIIEFRISMI